MKGGVSPVLEAYARRLKVRLRSTDEIGAAREILRADGIPEQGRSDEYVLWRARLRARTHYKADALADHPHPMTYCLENIAPKANVSDPEAFCAALVHEATGEWPGKRSS